MKTLVMIIGAFVLATTLTACGGRASLNLPAGTSVGVGIGVGSTPAPYYAPRPYYGGGETITTTRRTYNEY
jgi:hypothetical protein